MQDEKLDCRYPYEGLQASCASSYLLGPLFAAVRRELPDGGRVFELGCGNGSTAEALVNMGYEVTGVDPSESGIQIARERCKPAVLEVGSAYDDLVASYGRFPVVISLEVVEHCFWPWKFSKTLHDLLLPGGLAIISTPYHGYTKNLMLALLDKFDAHWSPLWDGGHIKFWSEATLGRLLAETGFDPVDFLRIGRIPPIAKSMMALARKPAL